VGRNQKEGERSRVLSAHFSLRSFAMNSSRSTVLSLDMIKKAEAIENLTRSLKQQMKADR